MKFRAIIISLVVLAFAASVFADGSGSVRRDDDGDQKVERTIAVDPAVTVSLCVTSGNITVRGWDRNEVTARSADPVQIELRKPEEMPAGSVKKLEIVVFNKAETGKPQGKCQAYSDLDLNVPKGATVLVQTRDGDISIGEVASAYAGTQNGDIEVQQISRSIEVGSIGGSICLKDSTGRVSVSSAGGSIDAANLRPVETGDSLEVVTTSGDINLTNVTHKDINTKTVSGNLTLTGPLAAAGRYWFNSFSGDVTLALPANASFKLMAKVSENGEIITDFPLTLTQVSAAATAESSTPVAIAETPEAPVTPAPPAKADHSGSTPKPAPAPAVKVHVKPVIVVTPSPKIAFSMRRITGVHGSGDATISVASFSGTLRLEQN
jgi:hypothetical protein